MAYTPENETDAGPGPACCGTATWTSGANHRGRLPLGFVPRRDGTPRPALRADDGDLDRAVDAAWGALRGSNEPPGTWLFRRGGRLVCLLPGDDGPPSAIPLGVDLMRLMLAQVATWRRRDQRGGTSAITSIGRASSMYHLMRAWRAMTS